MKRRLLIVEDDQGIRLTIVSALEQEGFIIHAAADGGEALRLLDSIPLPDCIVTDLNMHPMDGRTFLTKIRGNPLLKNIPAIVLSGEASAPDVKELTLRKPFELAQLLHAIEVVLLKPAIISQPKSDDVS